MAVAEKVKTKVRFAGDADAAELRAHLKTLAGVTRKGQIPVLECVLLKAGKGGWTLSASDLDVLVTIQLASASTKQAGAIAINAKALKALVDVAPADRIALSMNGDRLAFQSGAFSAETPTLPAEGFVRVTDTPAVVATIAPGILASALRMTRRCVTSEDTRYFLNGIQLTIEGGKVRSVATDGHRLSVFEAECGEGDGVWLLPIRAVSQVLRLCELGDPVTIAHSKSHVRFTSGHVAVTSRKIDATFPKYQSVVPKDSPQRAVVNRGALLAALDRVSVMANPRSRSVRFAFSANEIALSAPNGDFSEMGNAAESVAASLTGSGAAIQLNHNYVSELLGVSDADEFAIEFKDEMTQMLMRPVGDDRYMTVLMPMRA